jgi:predicted dehydrogenase
MEEFQEGCTVEHIGYHLVWICAMFGPVQSVTAFSHMLVSHKTDASPGPIETPDFSVACLNFANGVVARVTCTWVSPRDHRLRIIGEAGEISADNAFHDQARVHLERFSRVSLSARKAYTVRTHAMIGRLFGIGGRRLRLVRRWKSHAVESERGVGRTWKHKLVSWLRRREIYAQDKLLGIAEMARALAAGRPQPMPPDFLMHINEITLMVQRAGPTGATVIPTTTFEALPPLSDFSTEPPNYLKSYRPRFMERTLTGVVAMLHRR